MRAHIASHLVKIIVKHNDKILFIIFSLFISSSSYVYADAFPFWRFEPINYNYIQGETLNLTAILCNDSSATSNLYASTVANGAGFNYLPEHNFYQLGLDIDFADLYSQLNSVILSPGDCHNFVWGTVYAWKDVPYGLYTIDYASINGHNWSGAIVADNVFIIKVIPSHNVNYHQLASGVLKLLLIK